MARTIGALGKAKFVGVPLARLNEILTPNATVFVSIEHHGALLGVDRDTAPRVKTVMLGEPAPVHVATPTPTVGVEITLPAKPKEKAEAQIIDVNDY